MMRARSGWIVAMSSSDISFLPLEKAMARIFSSSSLSVMGPVHNESSGGAPPQNLRLWSVGTGAGTAGWARGGGGENAVAGCDLGRRADAAAGDRVEDEKGRGCVPGGPGRQCAARAARGTAGGGEGAPVRHDVGGQSLAAG